MYILPNFYHAHIFCGHHRLMLHSVEKLSQVLLVSPDLSKVNEVFFYVCMYIYVF